MLRFIPTFLNDIKQVGETLKIRGYRMTMGGVLRHPVMMLRLLFTPLLFRSLRTSEELGVAAELKGLESGCTLSPYRRPEWKFADTALVVAARRSWRSPPPASMSPASPSSAGGCTDDPV